MDLLPPAPANRKDILEHYQPQDHPILFKPAMVSAILNLSLDDAVGPARPTPIDAGLPYKWQTRRVVAPQPANDCHSPERSVAAATCIDALPGMHFWRFADSRGVTAGIRCPYGQPGDRLWVKSKWLIIDLVMRPEAWVQSEQASKSDLFVYRGKASREHADHVRYAAELFAADRFKGAFRSSLLMPRWASRITLEVTDVRLQRLQDISEEDAKAEGITPLEGLAEQQHILGGDWRTQGTHPYTMAFAVLWDTINADRGYWWTSNPWVWAISFRRLT